MDHSLRHCQHKADIKGKKDDSDTSTSDIRCSCMVAHYWITAATTWSLGIGESVIGWMTTTATCSGLISEARYCRHASTAPFIYMTRTSWIWQGKHQKYRINDLHYNYMLTLFTCLEYSTYLFTWSIIYDQQRQEEHGGKGSTCHLHWKYQSAFLFINACIDILLQQDILDHHHSTAWYSR